MAFRGPNIRLRIAPFQFNQIIQTLEISFLLQSPHVTKHLSEIVRTWLVLCRRRRTSPPSTASAKSPKQNTSISKVILSLLRIGGTTYPLVYQRNALIMTLQGPILNPLPKLPPFRPILKTKCLHRRHRSRVKVHNFKKPARRCIINTNNPQALRTRDIRGQSDERSQDWRDCQCSA